MSPTDPDTQDTFWRTVLAALALLVTIALGVSLGIIIAVIALDAAVIP